MKVIIKIQSEEKPTGKGFIAGRIIPEPSQNLSRNILESKGNPASKSGQTENKNKK